MANNSFVKFYRLKSAAYKAQTPKDANGIYFITDTHELIVNGVNYGMSSDLIDQLNGTIASVEFVSPNTINFKNFNNTVETAVTIPNAVASDEDGNSVAGLMSGTDKVILDKLNGTVDTDGSVKQQVAAALTSAESYTDTLPQNKK